MGLGPDERREDLVERMAGRSAGIKAPESARQVAKVGPIRRRLARGRRGVAPMLLGVIVVAVAAAVVVGGLFAAGVFKPSSGGGGGITTPLIGNFAWGTSTAVVGTTGYPGCAVGDYCWRLAIATANGGVTPSSLDLYVQNASDLTLSTSGWTFAFLTDTNSVAASAHGPTAGSSGAGWAGYGATVVLTVAVYLWIDTGGPTGYAGQSIILQTVGVNGFFGSVGVLIAT